MTDATATRTFKCIYCGQSGPEAGFDNEHVFPRSLCGRGANWTMVNRVCKTCNYRFSRFENELLHQAAETIARAFAGPLGRSARAASGGRTQPLKINHLYVFNVGDPLTYEGGFAFPAEFYFRPQMIDVGDGTIASLITDQSETQPFQDAVSGFIREPRITLPRPKGGKDYEIVSYERLNGRWRPGSRQQNKTPSQVFFREFIERTTRPPMTARLAQNDDGNLFVRAADLEAIGLFLDLISAGRSAAPRPPRPPGSGHQTFFFGLKIDLIKVYKAVLKTALNLVAHLYGDQALADSAFDRARRILLEDVESHEAATICQMSPGFTPDFPRVESDAHQMMLDEFEGGLRFRMRLYDSFGYTVSLAHLNESLRALIRSQLPKRILVEYERTGIREVQAWV
jgi:HNH endonuclease